MGFSRENPCIVCGAGMSHQVDNHAEWCKEQGKFNSTLGKGSSGAWPRWFVDKLNTMTPIGSQLRSDVRLTR